MRSTNSNGLRPQHRIPLHRSPPTKSGGRPLSRPGSGTPYVQARLGMKRRGLSKRRTNGKEAGSVRGECRLGHTRTTRIGRLNIADLIDHTPIGNALRDNILVRGPLHAELLTHIKAKGAIAIAQLERQCGGQIRSNHNMTRVKMSMGRMARTTRRFLGSSAMGRRPLGPAQSGINTPAGTHIRGPRQTATRAARLIGARRAGMTRVTTLALVLARPWSGVPNSSPHEAAASRLMPRI